MFPPNVASGSSGEVARLLVVQAAVVIVVAVALAAMGHLGAVPAALYGGAVELARSYLLGRRVRSAVEAAKAAPGSETGVLYLGAVQRFVLVLVLFGLGMGWLELQPVPLLAAFVAAQCGFFVAKGVWRVLPG